ncbi:MAG: SPFH domain-containing protein [Alphaproteobacteria bacterium]
MAENIIIGIVLAIIVIAIIYILSIWIYKRAPANMGFIRTGFLGTKVCLGRGAIVLPVFHEVTWVSLETIKLIVSRSREQAILTADKIRIDVTAELYTHVGRTIDDLLTASRSLGDKTFDADKVRNLLEAKVVSALRSYAATKSLSELHENRDALAEAIKTNAMESFAANGLTLEEVTIVALEQTGKEHLKVDNVFDAEGLKIITEITSDARRKVHDTEKRTTVAIRQKDLDTQLELLEIEKQEAYARANQDKSVSNEEALQMREKQVFILNQRMAVEEKEIENEVTLERMRTDREVAVTEEAKKREATEIRKALALEQERRDKEIAIIQKTKEEELAEIDRGLAREQAEKDKQIKLIAKEVDRQKAEIERVTKVSAEEEAARIERHKAAEAASLATRQQSLETKLSLLDMDKAEAFAAANQELEVSNEKARALSATQRYILEQRWEVQQEEIAKARSFETAQIEKDAAVIGESTKREAAEIQRELALEMEERQREIVLIGKEQERERADIQRFLAREREERDRQIALEEKTRELEAAEAQRLATTAEKRKAEHIADSVQYLADAERDKEIERIAAQKIAEAQRIAEEAKAQVSKMHMVMQSEARMESASKEAEATLTRAKATSDAQKITAEGIEREAGARGRAEAEIEGLKVRNTEEMLKAEASGLEAKAGALRKYNEAATFLELAKLFIEAERDVHIDQAKAMGNALEGAQIRMYGNGDGTMDTIRGLFNSGFGLGEAMEGLAQSLPDGVRDRFNANGLRGLFGRPQGTGGLRQTVDQLSVLVDRALPNADARDIPLGQAVDTLETEAGSDEAMGRAVAMLRELARRGGFDDVTFERVWTLLRTLTASND